MPRPRGRRLRPIALLTLVALACASTPRGASAGENTPADTAPARKSAELVLSDGRLAYERGDYAGAIALLTPLLYPSIMFGSDEATVDAHRILVLSYFLSKQELEAESEASAILALHPEFHLDPIVDPPQAVSFFERFREKRDEHLRELKSRAERVYMERTVEHHSRLVATIPFGVGQMQNGQPRKAALFLSAELVFAAASLGGYLALEQKYPTDTTTNRRYFPAAEKGTAQALIGLQLGAGIAFWATILWGLIDAHVLFRREVVKVRELPSSKLKMSLSPIVAPGLGGLAIQGAF